MRREAKHDSLRIRADVRSQSAVPLVPAHLVSLHLASVFLALLLLASVPAACQPQTPVPPAVTTAVSENRGTLEITYLANEGFLLRRGEHSVLVDALFGDGLPGYANVPGALRQVLEAAQPPFDQVDFVLATHFHGDHFDPQAVARFLANSPSSVFASSPDAVAQVRALLPGDSAAELEPHYPAVGETHDVSVADTDRPEVTILRLHHGKTRPEIQNLGFIVDFDGLRILHIGDTEATWDDFLPYRELVAEIDYAFLPAWFLTTPSYAKVTRELLRPRQIVAMHLAEEGAPPSWFGSDRTRTNRLERVRRLFPNALIAERPGQKLAPSPPTQARR